ncbi:MAG: gliding-associated putative transporter substrate-binding component GldG [Pedosphaera sp.]|nr:gliding-associated putative transporter substrate-binding component GldG [Pedosphaera sp.]
MKKNSFETILYSIAGVAVMLLILIAFNVITAVVKQRVDLTKEKAYTLSDGTRAILRKLDTPLKIRFYYSSSAELSADTLFLKTYAQQVDDLLSEYKQAANGKVIIEKFDPKPDSDAEDSARLDGVEGQMLPTGEKFYLGLSVSVVDAKEAIPFFRPDRERSLEYDVSRAISRVMTPDKPVVGIMTPLPVFGMPSNPMMARMGQQGQEPWIFVSELKADFNVKQVDMNADKIDDDIKVLIVIHPKNISDKAQYAIDQFIMRGGRLAAFLDASSIADKSNENQMMGQMPGGGSSLDKLLKAWGIQFDSSKVVADTAYKMQVGGRNNQTVDAPAYLAIPGTGINKDDVETSEIDNIWMILAGAFTGTPASGLKETVLLKSTKDSQLVEGMMAALAGDSILKDFKPSGIEYPLAIRLAGKFATAFPNGKPEDKAEDDKAAPGKKPEKPADFLKETKGDNAVVLFGDSDMLYDQVAFRQTMLGMIPANGNITLAQNVVEQLTGDSNLIGVRSRASMKRPFTRIKEMEEIAAKSSENKVKEFEESQRETQERLNELQKGKETDGQRFILSPEQQVELEKLKKKAADTNVQLRQEKKKLTRDKVALENRLKWENILVMPALVAISGICLATFKRKRTSAK